MLPRPFQYHRPETLDAALQALSRSGTGTVPYAGGTELLLLLKMHLADHEHLVDLKRIPELREIEPCDGYLRIGSMATHATIARDPDVRRIAPALADLCGSIANPRVRASGTIGGNLCFAEPTADPPVLLAAYGATLHLVSPRGARTLPADAFVIGPLETARADDEILVAIDIPAEKEATRYVRQLNGHRSLAGAGALLSASRDEAARVWLGGAAQRAVRLDGTAAFLDSESGAIDQARLVSVLHNEIAELDIAGDAEASADYRRHIAAVVTERAILAAAEASGREIAS